MNVKDTNVLKVINEVKKVVIGKDAVIEKMMAAILVQGHILIDDIPGVGKTTMALAFSKALGTGVRGFDFDEVQILRNELGAPYFEFSGRAKQIVKSRNLECKVSLSHEKDKAIAFVVLEEKP